MKKRLLILLLVLALGAAGLWYYRPVGVYDLAPGLEPESIAVTAIRTEGALNSNRTLTLPSGSEAFDDVLQELESLRFRRPPTNLIPPLETVLEDDGKKIDGYDYILYVTLIEENEIAWEQWLTLTFWIDEWDYSTGTQATNLSLHLSDGRAIGKTLGDYLWALPAEYESVS